MSKWKQESQVEQPELMDFEIWHAIRGPKIPKHHHKEILKADFRGQGLKVKETMETFDAALKKYGVELG